MKTLILLLCAVLPIQMQIMHYIQGKTLSGVWTLNITFLVDNFEGVIFQCKDTNNSLEIHSFRNTTTDMNEILLSYNLRKSVFPLISLCNCDPCHGKMTTFVVFASQETVKMKCNDYQSIQVNRINHPNRNRISETAVGDLFILFPYHMEGCLKSFLINNHRINWYSHNYLFSLECPRDCDRHTCNDGKCLAYRKYGPLCDCSIAARNGPFCNNHLRRYERGSITSFIKMNHDYNFEIKLSWENTMTQRFCLIELVSKYHHVTLILHKNRLFVGTKLVSTINQRKINFITISFELDDTFLKINNKMADHRLDLSGEIAVHIGLTRTKASCVMFNGKYEFRSDYSRLLPVSNDKNEGVITDNPGMDVKLIVISSVISFFVSLLVFIIIAGIFYYKRRNKEIIKTNNGNNRNDVRVEYKTDGENYDIPNFESMMQRPLPNVYYPSDIYNLPK